MRKTTKQLPQPAVNPPEAPPKKKGGKKISCKQPREKPGKAPSVDDGANMSDPNKVFSDKDDEALNEGGGQSNWADQMIVTSVHNLLREKPEARLLALAKEFCAWIEKFISKPSKPNAYKRWSATIKRSFASFDNRAAQQATQFVEKWYKQQAKNMCATKLYEPAQAERFLMRDILELWLHWLRSDKLVRREAALYSAITFFTGARAIEVGKLFIEDLYFEQEGQALVCPIRESKTNVYKDIPERLTMIFRPDCPIDLKALFLEIKKERTEGRLFQACKNRRTLCYHYARGALELGWSRTPSGHSGRTTAITLGIAVGIPREDLEINFRWASGSDMYRRYRSIHMECSQAGAPALIARALVGSLYSGPLGTPAPIERTSLKDENVDLGWYRQTISNICREARTATGVKDAREAACHEKPLVASPSLQINRQEPRVQPLAATPSQPRTVGIAAGPARRKPSKSKTWRPLRPLPQVIQARIDFLLGKDDEQ